MKIFISYARVDKPCCHQIAQRLQGVHEVWYDRRLHAGQDWWDEIKRRLDWCESFVYLLSPESVASEYCQREFAIATESGKCLVPVMIQARTSLPASLSHLHYVDLSESMDDIGALMDALTVAERNLLMRRTILQQPKSRKLKQSSTMVVDATPNMILAKAADALEAKNFDAAVFTLKEALEKKLPNRWQRIFQDMLDEAEVVLAHQAYLREAEREYEPIREAVKRPVTRAFGCKEFSDFQQHYPDYDPDNIAAVCAELAQAKQQTILSPPKPIRLRSIDVMPQPFEWIVIPGKNYSVAKYPTTNAQFARFIDAGGYDRRKWWTEAGWSHREKERWTEPRYWQASKWNGAEQPVVGVSWYEAVAFCLWLSDVTGEKIMLPTEVQWQVAAQGDDGLIYPWGNKWDGDRCNNSVSPHESNVTTPVTQYEGKGDSPFGVVDMAGNVWEWCLTDYNNELNGMSSGANVRVLRGGAWYYYDADWFRAAYRYRYNPGEGTFDVGFRIFRV